MTDRAAKAMTADLDFPGVGPTPFTPPGELAGATVAVVTTAALHHPEQEGFSARDTGFRILDGARRDVRLGHWSPNFDTSGFALDLNVVYPVDRLAELAEQGRIGAVAPHHLSFAGNQFDLTGIRVDAGPAAAKLLRDEGVDVVLLTPV